MLQKCIHVQYVLHTLPLLQVLQLHHSLSSNKVVILVGPSHSGKTTCYRILIAAYHKLSYPPVHCVPVNMSAYSFEQVYQCVASVCVSVCLYSCLDGVEAVINQRWIMIKLTIKLVIKTKG